MRYKSVADRVLYVRKAGVVVKPGDTFDSPTAIEDANFVLVVDAKKAPIVKED